MKIILNFEYIKVEVQAQAQVDIEVSIRFWKPIESEDEDIFEFGV